MLDNELRKADAAGWSASTRSSPGAFDSIHLARRSRCFSSTLVVRQALNHTRRDNPGVRNVMKIRLGYELIFDSPSQRR